MGEEDDALELAADDFPAIWVRLICSALRQPIRIKAIAVPVSVDRNLRLLMLVEQAPENPILLIRPIYDRLILYLISTVKSIVFIAISI